MSNGNGENGVRRKGRDRREPIVHQPTNAADRASLKILVIDDEATLRESCASVLRLEGYQVTVCGRGDEALDAGEARRVRHRAGGPVHDAGAGCRAAARPACRPSPTRWRS